MEPNGPSQEPPITAQVVSSGMAADGFPPYRQATPRRRGGAMAKFIILVLLGALALSMLINIALIGETAVSSADTPREEYFSQDKFREGKDKIAIISVEGTILAMEGFVKDQIDQARRDDKVKAVVLRVDSPGGSVAASDYLYHHLSKLRTESKKPIVVSMGSIAASGGYYISMAAGPVEKTIFAEPSCFTGSIGVMIPHYNLAGLFDKFGIEEDAIVSHRLKNMGSLGREMTEEEKAIFQELVDEGFGRFKQIIRDNRTEFGKNPEALDQLATGQVYTAQQAKDGGLIDEIDFIEAAIDRAIELAGVDRERVQVIRYLPTPSLASLLLGAQAQAQPRGLDLQQLFDMSAPKAYYMATQLPPLVRNAR